MQEHCHHKSVVGVTQERDILKATGLNVQFPEAGCCGMAVAFGFEKGEHYNVSISLATRNISPAVAAASSNTVLVANGFSCREQIEQTTGRKAIHLVELIKLGLMQKDNGVREMPDPSAVPCLKINLFYCFKLNWSFCSSI